MSAQQYQPRWLAWSRSLGVAPDDAGLKGHEFIVWINARWREWERDVGRRPHQPKSPADHAAFDAWLESQVPA